MGGITRNDIRKILKNIFRVRSWKLFLILIPLVFVAATLLRLDHLEMIRLREDVLIADESGDAERLNETLVALRTFTSTHIIVNFIERNGVASLTFGTGPFYLEYQYKRDARIALDAAEKTLGGDSNPSGNVFRQATDYCDPLAKRYGWGYSRPYFDCIMNELAKHPSMGELEDATKALVPPTGNYRINFASPVWHPSWAGWVVLVCLVMSVVIIVRLLIWITLKIALMVMKKR